MKPLSSKCDNGGRSHNCTLCIVGSGAGEGSPSPRTPTLTAHPQPHLANSPSLRTLGLTPRTQSHPAAPTSPCTLALTPWRHPAPVLTPRAGQLARNQAFSQAHNGRVLLKSRVKLKSPSTVPQFQFHSSQCDYVGERSRLLSASGGARGLYGSRSVQGPELEVCGVSCAAWSGRAPAKSAA